MTQPVQIAVSLARYHSNRQKEDQYTAEIATQSTRSQVDSNFN